jgi:hypothetical protein
MLDAHRKKGRKGENRSDEYRQKSLEYKNQLRQRDYKNVVEQASDQLQLRNIPFDADSQEFSTLCEGLLRTKMRVFEVMAEREDGNLSNGYDNGLLMRVRKRKTCLQELMDEYITMQGGEWGVRSAKKVEGDLNKIVDILGNIHTADISKDVCQHVHAELKIYPTNRDKPPFAGLPLDECRKLSKYKPPAGDTFKATWSRFSSLIRFGSENEKYGIKRNYAGDMVFRNKGGKHDRGVKRSVYDSYDIECLFKGLSEEIYVKQPHRYWVPLIGLFQGMRQNEICQLYMDDLIQVDGIDCIRITDDPNRNQSLSAESRPFSHTSAIFMLSCGASVLGIRGRCCVNI